jgi:hypothetical protein
MARRQTTGGAELGAVRISTRILTPGHFAGILVQVWAGDMMMLAEFGAAETGKVAFRMIGAGAIHAVGAPVIDPPHFVPSMQIVPGARLVGMYRAPPGDAPAGDRHGINLPRRDDRHRLATALAHHHDTAALSVLMPTPTPIDPLDTAISRSDMTAKPPSIDLDHATQGGRRGARQQAATKLVEQDERRFGVNIEISAHLEAADPLGGVDEQTDRQQQNLEREFA